VAEIAARFKGFTSHVLREEFNFLCSRLPTLWSRSCFAATVGSVTETAVRKYSERNPAACGGLASGLLFAMLMRTMYWANRKRICYAPGCGREQRAG
jgi:hypothetical protein